MHQWKVKSGTLTLISSVVTNGMALYFHNYNLYFQKYGDKDWYHIPVIGKGKRGEYELNLSSKAQDERMVRDARIEVKNNEIYLLRAHSVREHDYEDSPIHIEKYRFVESNGDDWPYQFQIISSRTYPTRKDAGVDSVLAQEAKQIK